MNQPLRPIDGHGQRFSTPDPLAIINWLMSDGWVLMLDMPAFVDLTRGQERVRVSADGTIVPQGDESHATARMLLLNSEEQKR